MSEQHVRHKRISKRGNGELRNRLVFGRLPFDLWPVWVIVAEANHLDNNKVLKAFKNMKYTSTKLIRAILYSHLY